MGWGEEGWGKEGEGFGGVVLFGIRGREGGGRGKGGGSGAYLAAKKRVRERRGMEDFIVVLLLSLFYCCWCF